jgi:cell division protein FtsN
VRHDFAKIRPEPLLEKKPAQTPPAWSMMITGIVVGMAIGVFASVLLYMSGNIPPLPHQQLAANTPREISAAPEAVATTAPESQAASSRPQMELEFYTELRNYEVPVPESVVPVPLREETQNTPLKVSYMLQSGAFQEPGRAHLEVERQQRLGLDVAVKVEELTGRTLYLVQSGPYTTQGQLDEAETILRRNAIPTLRTQVQ